MWRTLDCGISSLPTSTSGRVEPIYLHTCARTPPSRGRRCYLRRPTRVAGVVDWFRGGGKTSGEERRDPDLVPIDPDAEGGLAGTSESVFGPLAMLLVGFNAEEKEALRMVMLDMDADMVKLLPCNAAMMRGTLQQALESDVQTYEQLPQGTKRCIVLSGMYGSEVVEVISAYKAAGLPATVWAAAVPNNYSSIVSELVDEVYADHQHMKEQTRKSATSQ